MAREPMEVTFFGVRGTRTVPDPRFATYGGNTACVGVAVGSTQFLLDAGSGIADVPEAFFSGGPIRIFLSHLHHDHIAGLMFFRPIYEPGREIILHVPEHLANRLSLYWRSPYFPLNMSETPARLSVVPVHGGETIAIGRDGVRDEVDAGSQGAAVCVDALSLGPHVHPKDGVYAFRIRANGKRIVYATDMELVDEESTLRVSEFAQGAAALILDAHFTDDEYRLSSVGWGHNSIGIALDVGQRSACERLFLFHHHPERDDAALALLEREAKTKLPHAAAAAEGATWAL